PPSQAHRSDARNSAGSGGGPKPPVPPADPGDLTHVHPVCVVRLPAGDAGTRLGQAPEHERPDAEQDQADGKARPPTGEQHAEHPLRDARLRHPQCPPEILGTTPVNASRAAPSPASPPPGCPSPRAAGGPMVPRLVLGIGTDDRAAAWSAR